MEKRCDGNIDCSDGSDEEDCRIFKLSSGYKAIQPPKSLASGKPLEVFLDLELDKLTSVKEISLKFGAVLKATFTWFDKRLSFANLKKDSVSNMVSGSTLRDLWLPRVKFRNSIDLEAKVVDDEDYALIHRINLSNVNDLQELDEELIFDGSDNPISLIRLFKVNIYCAFDLALFPFDEQACPIRISPIISNNDLVHLTLNSTSYRGPEIFHEYSIYGMVPGDQNLKAEPNEVVAIVKLKRIINYHLAITFLPSLCLIAIAELTLFIDDKHFEATIMVALTSMLVMYTLYQSVSLSLPQTPYLKMIDLWLLAGLLIPFLVFIFLICSNIFDSNHDEAVKEEVLKGRRMTINPAEALHSMKTNDKTIIQKVLELGKIFIVIGTTLFIAVYWISAIAVSI